MRPAAAAAPHPRVALTTRPQNASAMEEQKDSR